MDTLDGIKLLVIGCPKDFFSKNELDALKKYIQSGRSVFILLNEGGETKLGTNINYLLEQFGMSVNSDSVVRTSFYKYLHPKEAFVANGNLSEDFTRLARGQGAQSKDSDVGGYAAKYQDSEAKPKGKEGDGLDFVYCYGSTLTC